MPSWHGRREWPGLGPVSVAIPKRTSGHKIVRIVKNQVLVAPNPVASPAKVRWISSNDSGGIAFVKQSP